MNIEQAAQAWLDGGTIKGLAKQYHKDAEVFREALIDHFGEERYLQLVKEKKAKHSPPIARPKAQYNLEAAVEDWLAGMTLQDVRKKHKAGNDRALRLAIRAHLGDEEYERQVRLRKAVSGTFNARNELENGGFNPLANEWIRGRVFA